MDSKITDEALFEYYLAKAVVCNRRAIADYGFVGYVLRLHSYPRDSFVRYNIRTAFERSLPGSISQDQLTSITATQLKLMADFAEGVERCQTRTYDRGECESLAWLRALDKLD